MYIFIVLMIVLVGHHSMAMESNIELQVIPIETELMFQDRLPLRYDWHMKVLYQEVEETFYFGTFAEDMQWRWCGKSKFNELQLTDVTRSGLTRYKDFILFMALGRRHRTNDMLVVGVQDLNNPLQEAVLSGGTLKGKINEFINAKVTINSQQKLILNAFLKNKENNTFFEKSYDTGIILAQKIDTAREVGTSEDSFGTLCALC